MTTKAQGSSTRDIGDGIGIGLGFVAGAVLCLIAIPDYLGTTPGWTTFWQITGGLLGLAGMAGALTELSKVSSLDGAGYIGAALVIGAPAGVLHVLQERGVVGNQLATGFRILAVLLILFALTGLGMGVGRLAAALLERKPATPVPGGSTLIKISSLTTAILGFIAAVLNFTK